MQCRYITLVWNVAWAHFIAGLLLSTVRADPRELDEIVTVARRIDTPRNQVTGAVTVINAEDLARSRQPILYEALRRVPGLRIARTGGPGQPAKLYLRGAEPRQTVVLIDGVSLRSPNAADVYALGALSTANVERIEILRGAQSSLYGSDAVGGVINVVTKRGKGKASGAFSIEGGSMNTLRSTWTANGSKNRLAYAMVVDHYETEGVSAAKLGLESDAYENDYLQGRMDYQLSDVSRLSFFGFQSDALSNADIAASVDGNFQTNEKNYALRSQWELAPEVNEWRSTFGVSRKGFHSNNGFGSYFQGYSTEFDLRVTTELSDQLSLGFGLDHTDEHGKSSFGQDVTMRVQGGYINSQLEMPDDFFLNLAVRHDDNDRYGGETTGKGAFSKAWGDWRAYGSVGTFFVAPNAFYYVWAANPFALEPESGVGRDFGLERNWLQGRVQTTITWFERDTDKEFDWVHLKVVNVDVQAKGVEGELTLDLNDYFAVDFAFTLQETRDMMNNRDLYSRPEKMFSGALDWQSSDDLIGVNLGFRYVGERLDVGNQVSSSFTVWDMTTIIEANQNWDIHLRIENLLDKDYTEMVDWGGEPYGTFGRSAFLGLTWRY
jgi:vitamin B12 transporter